MHFYSKLLIRLDLTFEIFETFAGTLLTWPTMALTRYNGLLPSSLTLDFDKLGQLWHCPSLLTLGLFEKFRDSSQNSYIVLCFIKCVLVHLIVFLSQITFVTIMHNSPLLSLSLIPRAHATCQVFASCKVLNCLEIKMTKLHHAVNVVSVSGQSRYVTAHHHVSIMIDSCQWSAHANVLIRH